MRALCQLPPWRLGASCRRPGGGVDACEINCGTLHFEAGRPSGAPGHRPCRRSARGHAVSDTGCWHFQDGSSIASPANTCTAARNPHDGALDGTFGIKQTRERPCRTRHRWSSAHQPETCGRDYAQAGRGSVGCRGAHGGRLQGIRHGRQGKPVRRPVPLIPQASRRSSR